MFRHPIHVGELVTFSASVNYTGASSTEVDIKVVAEDIGSQETRHVNSRLFIRWLRWTMTANRFRLPSMRPFSPGERRRHAAAIVRKELRRNMERMAAQARGL